MKNHDYFIQAEKLRSEEKLTEAIESYQQIVTHTDEPNFEKAESFHMIGLVYYQLKKYPDANHYLIKAEELFQQMNDQDMHAAVLRDRAAVAIELTELDKAEQLLTASIQLLEETQNKGHLGISKVKLATVLKQKGRLNEAEQIMLEGMSNIKDSSEHFFESSAYFSLAKLQKEKNPLGEAKSSASRALEILEKITTPDQHQKRKQEFKQFIKDLS